MLDLRIAELFASDVSRRIEEIIKVDQDDERLVYEELAEYVVTDSMKCHFIEVFEHFWETPNKPHEAIGIWISGFFGSGKSSFAKYLGLALANRRILGNGAATLLARRIGDPKAEVLLKNIAEHIPTESVIFDVSTYRGIRTGNQAITEIMYRVLLQHLGYARDLDLAELEITLEEDGRLDAFEEAYRRLYNKEWDNEKGKVAIAVQQASRVMHEIEPQTYPTVDSWRESALHRADITPALLAERARLLMERRRPGKTLVFVIDEVGQFVARDVQKMLDLQAVIHSLGRVGRGRMWLVVTSQERLTELVSGIDDRRIELARLMDRFAIQVHLEPSDISEVTSKRILSKNARAQKTLRELFSQYRGRLTENTRISAAVRLPELSVDSFINLYPLLPHHIDLIIDIVSGLRTQGGASKHVGGANRTIIKLAQQLLVHPEIDLQNQKVGALARIDQVYDLIHGNIPSEIRRKIADIPRYFSDSATKGTLEQRVAKVVCLLGYAPTVRRTAENIAALLHTSIEAGSQLTEVNAALAALEAAHLVRKGDDGYRIPSPVEDDWEQQRSGLQPRPGDVNRLHAEAVLSLWQPQPSYNFHNVKLFKASLHLNGSHLSDGDVRCYVTFANPAEYEQRLEEARRRSQTERSAVFWVASLSQAIDRETTELYRSREILARRERSAQTRDEAGLVAEERLRQRRHQDQLRRLLQQALLGGVVYFRGNERSVGNAGDVKGAVSTVLGQILPEVYDRFREAAARVGAQDLNALLTNEDLRGLTPVFTELQLVRSQDGKVIFNTDTGPLAAVFSVIENRTGYGDVADGRYLVDEFAREPFGWDFDAVRLFVVALLRAGKIEATSKGQVIDSALSLESRTTFPNNNLFRQASFRPKVGVDFVQISDAAFHFQEVFGREISELEQGVVAKALRDEIGRHEEDVQDALSLLIRHRLPGQDILQSALNQMRAVRTGNDETAIRTFNTSYNEIKEGVKRARELSNALNETAIHVLQRAQRACSEIWGFLQTEHDVTDATREVARELTDLLAREAFFRELPLIDQHSALLEREYRGRLEAALQKRAQAYQEALSRLYATPGWRELSSEQQKQVADPLLSRASNDGAAHLPIPLLRADVDACPARLEEAVERVLSLVEGNRLARVDAGSYFSDGIETEREFEEALEAFRTHCLELIRSGKKLLIK